MDDKVARISDVEAIADGEDYDGLSMCRLCGRKNGSEEYNYEDENGIKFFWPEGLIHYYVKHNVLPSEQFYEFVFSALEKKKLGKKKDLIRTRQKKY